MWRKRVPSTGISDASFVLPYSKGASSKLQGGELEALGPRQAAKEMRVWAGLTLMVNMHLASAGRPFRKEVFFNFVEMMPPSLIPGETPHFRNLKNQMHFPHPVQLHLGINIRP